MIKNTIKKIIPNRIWRFLQKEKALIRLTKYASIQNRRFINFSANPWNSSDKEKLRGRMVFFIHRVEKGLTHDADFRPGFGKNALMQLHETMTIWSQNHYSTNDTTYLAAQSVIDAYIVRHKKQDLPLPSFLDHLFPEQVKHAKEHTDLSGTITIKAEDKTDNKSISFAKLFENRTSMRMFANTPVNQQKVAKAIQIAMKTPSVCNRQAYRVTLIRKADIIADVLRVQGGWRGYDFPPELAIITTDIRSFINVEERNEPYVDGGIFTMSLLLSLEYEGLAACPLNLMCSSETERTIRSLTEIPEWEALIVCIAIGNFPEHALAPKSFRYSGDTITRVIE